MVSLHALTTAPTFCCMSLTRKCVAACLCRRRHLLATGFQAMTQHVDIMTAYRESIATRDAAFGAWHARARAKALQTSLVTARGKLRRQVPPARPPRLASYASIRHAPTICAATHPGLCVSLTLASVPVLAVHGGAHFGAAIGPQMRWHAKHSTRERLCC